MDRFPPIEPYASGLLDVGEGHRVYWECSGSPSGEPALFLHGGPGAGAHAGARRFFDPARFRIVAIDQRGCGRSRPLASDDDANLSTNTTPHLVADLEKLRVHLAIERWSIVLGMSWGTTLALAYAHAHRTRIDRLVLALLTTTSHAEVAWITEGVGAIFPREWERFRDAVPDRLRHPRLVDAYAEWLFDPDPAERDRAARAWCAWEDAHVSLTPGHQPFAKFEDPAFRLGFARLVTHYWRHAAFLDGALLRDAAVLDGLPGEIIHGRYDVSGPLGTAWELAKRWKTSQLTVLENAGHGGGDDFLDAVLGAVHVSR
jgi:proline iminopeptidase